MKRILGLALGVMTAIGGFVDIGDLVTNGQVGSRFGLSLSWVVVLGVIGICLFAHMSGKVAAVSGRATFELIRERLGPRASFANMVGSLLINTMTVVAEVGGVALALELASSVSYLLWMPLAAFGIWLIVWRAKFSMVENIGGLMGLALIAFTVAVFLLHPGGADFGALLRHTGGTGTDNGFTYWYFAVALFGAAMTPYEVFFFSSGGVEEGWTPKDLLQPKLNLFVGFPLGGILSLSIATVCGLVLLPVGAEVTALSDLVLPIAAAGGKLLVAVVIIGMVGATLGAALETTLSTGYTLAQYFGWSWGKFRKPQDAARFHASMLITLVVAIGVLLTGVDPVMITELSVVFAAVALPLTYIPILIVSNDPEYMGEYVNGPVTSALGVIFLVLVLAASIAAIPLLIITGAGS